MIIKYWELVITSVCNNSGKSFDDTWSYFDNVDQAIEFVQRFDIKDGEVIIRPTKDSLPRDLNGFKYIPHLRYKPSGYK